MVEAKAKKKRTGGQTRSGTVALLGRPNVGKSTMLNAALDLPLAIVSKTPQTTRDSLLGVLHREDVEIAILDTPGLHKPKTELGRVMNDVAREAARAADVVILVTEVPKPPPGGGPLAPHPGDLVLIADVDEKIPVILVVNKIDRLKDMALLFPLLEALGAARSFAAVIPISAIKSKGGVERVLDEVSKHLPEGPFRYGEDDLTDRPMRFFAAEYVREQILRATAAEVPHAVAVVVDDFTEPAGGGVSHISATIHVERPGQKRILIGTGGEMLKRVGTLARKRFESLYGRQINLKLWVRVTPNWRESVKDLADLGYTLGGKRDEAPR